MSPPPDKILTLSVQSADSGLWALSRDGDKHLVSIAESTIRHALQHRQPHSAHKNSYFASV